MDEFGPSTSEADDSKSKPPEFSGEDMTDDSAMEQQMENVFNQRSDLTEQTELSASEALLTDLEGEGGYSLDEIEASLDQPSTSEENWSEGQEATRTMIEGIGDRVADSFDKLGGAVEPFTDRVANSFEKLGDAVEPFTERVEKSFDSLQESEGFERMVDQGGKALEQLQEKAGDTFERFTDMFESGAQDSEKK